MARKSSKHVSFQRFIESIYRLYFTFYIYTYELSLSLSLSKHEDVIIGAIKRNTSDLELRREKTKVGKQGDRSPYIFEIIK